MSSHKRAPQPQPRRSTVRSPAPIAARRSGLLQIQSSAGNRAAGEFVARSVDQIHREKAPSAKAASPPAAASPRRAQFGIAGDTLTELRAFARKHGVRIYVRQPNPHSAAHIDAGAAPKPMEVKAKSINIWDTHLHPKIGPGDRGLTGYFEPELPKDLQTGKYTNRQRIQIRRRYKARLAEFRREAASMKLLEGTAPDRGLAVRVKDGVVYQVEPDSVRRFEGGPHERRPRQIPQSAERLTPLAGDVDIFDFVDLDGKPLSRASYAAMDTAAVEAGLSEHGAHMRWKARGKARGVKRSMMATHALASGGVDQLIRIGPDGMTRVAAAEFKRVWPKGYKRAQRMDRRRARKEARQTRKKARRRRKHKTKRRAGKEVSTKQRRKAARARRKARRLAAKVKTPSTLAVDAPSARKPPKVNLGELGSAKVKLPGGGRRLAKALSGAVVQVVLEMVITELIQGPFRRKLAKLDGKWIQGMFRSDVAPALASTIRGNVAKTLESDAAWVARSDRLWVHFPWYLETEVVAEDWKDVGYFFSGMKMEFYEAPHRAFVNDGQTLSINSSPKNPYGSQKRTVRDEKGTRYHTYPQVASVIVHDASAVSFVKALAREEKAIRKQMTGLREQLRGNYLDGAVPPHIARQFRKVSKSIDALWLRSAVAHLEALAKMMAKEDDVFPLSAGIVVDDIVARQKHLKRLWGLMDSDSRELASSTAGDRTVNLALQ
jgi:hypothetical protein